MTIPRQRGTELGLWPDPRRPGPRRGGGRFGGARL